MLLVPLVLPVFLHSASVYLQRARIWRCTYFNKMKMHNRSNKNASYSATTDSKTFPKVNLVPASALVESKWAACRCISTLHGHKHRKCACSYSRQNTDRSGKCNVEHTQRQGDVRVD